MPGEITKDGVELQIRKHCDEKSEKILSRVEQIGKDVREELKTFGGKIDHLTGVVEEHEERINDLENNPGEEARDELDRLARFRDKAKIALLTLLISIPLTLIIGAVTYFLISAIGG